jgi:bifunctional ADP-heptose synthase (sugar kinase/adenylyltransferase)
VGVFTLALACGASKLEAAHLANFAAGIVVGKVGTATTSRKELLREIKNNL